MKNCAGCKYAEWDRTKSGSLHPSGDGRCGYPWKLPALPASMYWVNTPGHCGGLINRRRELKDHCVYFARA
jgi:hypothetical protein